MSDPAPSLMTIRDVCREFQIGRTKLYAQLNSGALRAVKIGRSTRIHRHEVELWLAGQPAYPSPTIAGDAGGAALPPPPHQPHLAAPTPCGQRPQAITASDAPSARDRDR